MTLENALLKVILEDIICKYHTTPGLLIYVAVVLIQWCTLLFSYT